MFPSWFADVQTSCLVGSWKIGSSMSIVHNLHTIQYLLHHCQRRTWYRKMHRCLIAGNSELKYLDIAETTQKKEPKQGVMPTIHD